MFDLICQKILLYKKALIPWDITGVVIGQGKHLSASALWHLAVLILGDSGLEYLLCGIRFLYPSCD